MDRFVLVFVKSFVLELELENLANSQEILNGF
jgi:hypothetical protein